MGVVHRTLTEEKPRFQFQFAPVFNGQTFWAFLKLLVRRSRRKIFLIIDNGPCHNLDDEGKAWLAANRARIELSRLPPYSPEFNPIEGVWKQSKKWTTHNTFYRTTTERDAALTATFSGFQARPSLIAGQVARFLGCSHVCATLFSRKYACLAWLLSTRGPATVVSPHVFDVHAVSPDGHFAPLVSVEAESRARLEHSRPRKIVRARAPDLRVRSNLRSQRVVQCTDWERRAQCQYLRSRPFATTARTIATARWAPPAFS